MPNRTDEIQVAARLEELVALYERSAYVVYNVAARVAGDREAAEQAATRAMLAQVTEPDADRLPLDVARFAIEDSRPVDPREFSDPVLAANAKLSSPVRASLALSTLARAPDEDIARVLGVEAADVEELRARGIASLGQFLGLPPGEAEDAYGALDWGEPPDELWQTLYPKLHAAVMRHPRPPEPVHASAAARPRRPRRPRLGVVLRPLRRAPRWALVLLLVLAAGGAALASRGGGDDSSNDGAAAYNPVDGLADDAGAASGGGGSIYNGLSPRELDRLRKRELEDLRRYSKEQADKRLPRGQRRAAGRRAKNLAKLAIKREREAAKREYAARRQLALERARRIRAQQRAENDEPAQERTEREPTPRRPPAEEPAEPTSPRDDDKPSDDGAGGGGGNGATAECFYDAERGTYTCPQ